MYPLFENMRSGRGEMQLGSSSLKFCSLCSPNSINRCGMFVTSLALCVVCYAFSSTQRLVNIIFGSVLKGDEDGLYLLKICSLCSNSSFNRYGMLVGEL